MTNATARATFKTDLAAEKEPPEWVEVFPAGPRIVARDGRAWTANPTGVLTAFAANNGPLAIDYEHAQAHLAPNGQEAPAAGWIVDLQERDGAVWGRVEWTARAGRMIVDREYRFLSPDFQYRSDGQISRLNGAGLVNRPALELTALSRQQTSTVETTDMKAIAKALGLAETADEKAIVDAIAARDAERTAVCQALKLDAGKSDTAAITGAVTKLAEDTATALAAVQNAPAAAEMVAVRKELTETKTALAAIQIASNEKAIDEALDAATRQGKITPASRGDYRAMCAVEGGLERFNNLVKSLPVIAAPSDLDGKEITTVTDQADATALAAKARKYQDEQAAIGRTVSMAEAVLTVKDQK
jgi:phage I-like protein